VVVSMGSPLARAPGPAKREGEARWVRCGLPAGAVHDPAPDGVPKVAGDVAGELAGELAPWAGFMPALGAPLGARLVSPGRGCL
jgi:hypothetical protein